MQDQIVRRYLLSALPPAAAAQLWCVCVRDLAAGATQAEVTERVRERCEAWARYQRKWKRWPDAVRERAEAMVLRQWSRGFTSGQIDGHIGSYRRHAPELMSNAALSRRLRRERRPKAITVHLPDGQRVVIRQRK